MPTTIWDGAFPHCDLCHLDGIHTPAPYDSPLTRGRPWANLCEKHLASDGLPKTSLMVTERVHAEAP